MTQVTHETTAQSLSIPSVSVNYATDGTSTKADEMGMRPMQAKAYSKRGEQYLLIKSPPASGKSRALMFIALDKITNQGQKQAIIVVPEKAIGASFNNEPLTKYGFWADWVVEPKWNLCNAPGTDESDSRPDDGKIKAVQSFLNSDDTILVCTHASFRFAVERFGVEAFDNRLIAIDEFHHVSANTDNILGSHLKQFMERDKTHIVAMTGSYFRGDGVAVLHPDDEQRFDSITYTYYEQLNGYEYLKELHIGYYFYAGRYVDDILKVLDPLEKTIIHIPSVQSRESTKDKIREAENIIDRLGKWDGTDDKTGFQLVKTKDGRVLKIADLVDDNLTKRDKVITALKDPSQKNNRDHVDIIIALGMAKEGFDWIWCEHALTIGYRSSLTEIVQIIGRTTRDAPGKTYARFTNLIAEPDAESDVVTEAVNETLKAIAVSLLMEQVLAPRFEFKPKNKEDKSKPRVDYNSETGAVQIEIKGLVEPKSAAAKKIIRDDLIEIVASAVQDKTTLQQAILNDDIPPQEITQVRVGKIIAQKYPQLSEDDIEAVRQRAVAAVNLTRQAHNAMQDELAEDSPPYDAGQVDTAKANTAFVTGVRKFVDVRDLSIDLIDSINPFQEAYAILAKTMSENNLRKIAEIVATKNIKLTEEEARDLTKRAIQFRNDRGRNPQLTASDPWEKRMAQGVERLKRIVAEKKQEKNND